MERDIIPVGVKDLSIDLFEGQYAVPKGMKYNSYLIKDEKTAVFDTVERGFAGEWLFNLESALGGAKPDYLIVQHMEPDHSGSISAFAERWPEAVVVASAKAFSMMKAFYGDEYAARRLVVKEGDVLPLGKHSLRFIGAPMVHWPEVLMTLDETTGTLFSADAFGRFGADGETDGEYVFDEARRYYFGIVGKYGTQVRSALKKLEGAAVNAICPTHGNVIEDGLGQWLKLYSAWADYAPETDGVLIAYTSVYGNTKAAAELLAELLKERCCENVVLTDLARSDVSRAVADAFRFDKLVLASTTYNNEVFPPMRTFISELTERNFQKRTVGIIENGSWAPQAAKVMKAMLEKSKDMVFAEPTVTITSSLGEGNRAQLTALADALCGR
jgi:flavorubredoxin